MKRCPACKRIETDDTLVYCRLDGGRLVSFDSEAATAVFDPGKATGAKTGKVTSPVRRTAKSGAIESIAVLPFENCSNDPNMEYLSDGITENVINTLSQLPKLKVMARSTVFCYKGRQVDVRLVGSELGVGRVVTGRVQQLADRLTIGIELVNVTDGSQLWGERYSRQISDIFALQEEISAQISSSLRLKLSGLQKRRLRRIQTQNSEAYQLYLQGRYFWNKRTEDDAKKGIERFQQALALDPNFALAYAGLADCQTLLGDVGVQAMPPAEAFKQGQRSAARALEIDEALAEAHGTMGHLKMHLFDWPGAETELLRALKLNANYAQAYLWYAYYLAFTGQFKDSLQAIDRSLQLDPLSQPVNRSAAELLYFAGRLDEAVEQFQQLIEMDPQHSLTYLELGRVYEQRSMYEAAISAFSKACELAQNGPESLASLAHCYAVSGATQDALRLLSDLTEMSAVRYVSAYDLALLHGALGQKEKCFAWLNTGYEIHDGWMIYITVDPRWQSLRGEPGFIEVVRRVGLNQ